MTGSAWNSGTCDRNRPEGKKVYAYTPAVSGSHPREKVDLIANWESGNRFCTAISNDRQNHICDARRDPKTDKLHE